MELVKDLEKLTKPIPHIDFDDIENKMTEILIAVDLMKETLNEHLNGVGLSANQIGIELPIFLIKYEGIISVYLNPSYTPYRDPNKPNEQKTVFRVEGCLSLPGIVCSVTRYKKIEISGFKLKYSDNKFYKINEIKTGLFSTIFQHERDHLSGKTILHKANYLAPDPNMTSIFVINENLAEGNFIKGGFTDFLIDGENETMFHKVSINDITINQKYISGLKKNGS